MKRFWLKPVPARGCLVAFVLLFFVGKSRADCWFATPDTNVTITVTVPATLAVLRDLPIGTELFRSNAVRVSGVAAVRCDFSGTDRWGYFSTVGTTSATGPSPIGTTGLGWRWIYDGWQLAPYPDAGFMGATSATGVNTSLNALQIVKMGDIVSGTLPAGIIGTLRAGNNGLDMVRMRLSNAITLTEATCQTPSINVPMGRHRSREFGAIGSTVGQTPFNIQLNNCPSALSSITYRLDPINPAFNAAQGILAINPGGAQGVGIQITDSNNKPVGLGQRLRFVMSPTSVDYVIPFYAAYYKTAREVTGGVANAGLQLTITYR